MKWLYWSIDGPWKKNCRMVHVTNRNFSSRTLSFRTNTTWTWFNSRKKEGLNQCFRSFNFRSTSAASTSRPPLLRFRFRQNVAILLVPNPWIWTGADTASYFRCRFKTLFSIEPKAWLPTVVRWKKVNGQLRMPINECAKEWKRGEARETDGE